MNKYNFHQNKKANKSVYDIVTEVSQIHAKKIRKSESYIFFCHQTQT